MPAHTGGTRLHLSVDSETGAAEVDVDVHSVYNFGYAARDTSGVATHIAELRELGLPAPTRLPAIFRIPPERAQHTTGLPVCGDDTYGEVEFALINTHSGWLVTIASDHTDLDIEKVDMAKAKAACPDVIGDAAWRLDEVTEHWDDCELRLWGRTADGAEHLIQAGTVGHLLEPADMQRILAERSGREPDPGTVILSGTIDGAPTPGMCSWRATLADPHRGRTLSLDYTVIALSPEI